MTDTYEPLKVFNPYNRIATLDVYYGEEIIEENMIAYQIRLQPGETYSFSVNPAECFIQLTPIPATLMDWPLPPGSIPANPDELGLAPE